MWVEKYRPENPSQMVGNEDVRICFQKWLSGWKRGSKPALLLGPPGTGKTTLVHALAKFLGFAMIELNASDTRTKEKLEHKLGPSLHSDSILGEKRLIFLDEVDGIYGVQDRGGLDSVQELIKSSTLPVVMAANVEDDSKVQKLASKSEVFRLRRIPPRLVEIQVREILRREGISLGDTAIEDLVRKSGGDMRVAVNSLQMVALRPESSTEGVLVEREESLTLKECLNLLFEAEDLVEGKLLLGRCDASPRDKLRQVFTSIVSSGLEAESLIDALEGLSRTDQLLGWIVRSQEWRLLRYFDSVLVSAVVNHLPRGRVKSGEDDLPWPLKLRIWNEGRSISEMALRLARVSHTSRKNAAALYLPYLSLMAGLDEGFSSSTVRLLRLDESGQKVLLKEAARAREVVGK